MPVLTSRNREYHWFISHQVVLQNEAADLKLTAREVSHLDDPPSAGARLKAVPQLDLEVVRR